MILRASFERNLSCAFIESRLAWLKSRLAWSVLIWLMCFCTAGETTAEKGLRWSSFSLFFLSMSWPLAESVSRMSSFWPRFISMTLSWFWASSSQRPLRSWIRSWKFSKSSSWIFFTSASSFSLPQMHWPSNEARFSGSPADRSFFLRWSTSLRRSVMMLLYSAMCSSTSFLFSMGLVFMFLARLAYFRVFTVSSNWAAAGETVTIMTVLQLPPSESLSRRVSFESR